VDRGSWIVGRASWVLLLVLGATAPDARGQSLPSEPLTFAGGRAVIGGDVSAGIATDDTGFFNYSDYEHSTLRELRLAVTGAVRATDRISVLAELRSENLARVQPFALYVRVRPWPSRRFDVQIGRIPPTFGAFTRRAYGHDNPLIGYPLAYQYLTSLRPDSAAANADDLVRMRGRGWLSNFTLGDVEPARGLPLVTVFSWDTGVQVGAGWRGMDVAAAITNGTASNPKVEDDNDGKQFAARITGKPAPGVVIGASLARGEFLTRQLATSLSTAEASSFTQRAYGLDLEYARGHWLVRSDAVMSEWRVPVVGAPRIGNPLRAVAVSTEGRYMMLPGLYAAARAEHLGFNRVETSTEWMTWEAPVTRVEIGGGYYLQRNVILRMSIQHNRRDGGRVRVSTLPAMQLLYWF
jgi:hypothetical protein